MFRTFVLPVVLMGIVGAPLLYLHSMRDVAKVEQQQQAIGNAPVYSASHRSMVTAPAAPMNNLPTDFPRTPSQYRQNYSQQPIATSTSNATYQAQLQEDNQMVTSTSTDNARWNQPGMVPDFARAQTLVFPGDANGPDLTAQPMSFTPTLDLSTLFRFDISKQWILSRWDRVSTCPADQNLHGMRVALVTGTNSWDLHGSQTYYFDDRHRVQRITFRGWTGDATRLLQILQQNYRLRPQPTHLAGLYLSKRSGLIMKHPAVIDKTNPVQRLALVLEINNPQGKTKLSDDFRSLLPAALSSR